MMGRRSKWGFGPGCGLSGWCWHVSSGIRTESCWRTSLECSCRFSTDTGQPVPPEENRGKPVGGSSDVK
ncbi:unnamed protein product [Pieris macdunnoughi]|uniref:Uncharacterized protein n=1 Tax=Pieris macdunnoughi TaxID=345717 RepID=A0A821W5T5_9NEOP|nr:unnamed protein product [Pieris macdunnoughi]